MAQIRESLVLAILARSPTVEMSVYLWEFENHRLISKGNAQGDKIF